MVLYRSGRIIEPFVCGYVDAMAIVENNMFSTMQFLFLYTSSALKIMGVQRSNTAENRSLNAQDGVTPVTLNAMIFD